MGFKRWDLIDILGEKKVDTCLLGVLKNQVIELS
jgi:hypothetical protein